MVDSQTRETEERCKYSLRIHVIVAARFEKRRVHVIVEVAVHVQRDADGRHRYTITCLTKRVRPPEQELRVDGN